MCKHRQSQAYAINMSLKTKRKQKLRHNRVWGHLCVGACVCAWTWPCLGVHICLPAGCRCLCDHEQYSSVCCVGMWRGLYLSGWWEACEKSSIKSVFGVLNSCSGSWVLSCHFLQSRCPSDEDTSLKSYHHVYSRTSRWGGAGVYLSLRSSCPVSRLYCALCFQSAARSFLCPFILFFFPYKPWETRLHSSRDQRTHTRSVLPHAAPRVLASSKYLNLHLEIWKIKFWECNLSSQSWGSLDTPLWKRHLCCSTGKVDINGGRRSSVWRTWKTSCFPSKLMLSEYFKTRFHKDAAFSISTPPPKH